MPNLSLPYRRTKLFYEGRSLEYLCEILHEHNIALPVPTTRANAIEKVWNLINQQNIEFPFLYMTPGGRPPTHAIDINTANEIKSVKGKDTALSTNNTINPMRAVRAKVRHLHNSPIGNGWRYEIIMPGLWLCRDITLHYTFDTTSPIPLPEYMQGVVLLNHKDLYPIISQWLKQPR